jgi:hypothetical protein
VRISDDPASIAQDDVHPKGRLSMVTIVPQSVSYW